jgi:hypothetical protein
MNSDLRVIAAVSRPKTASAMQNGGERPDAECHGSKFGREKEEAIAALLRRGISKKPPAPPASERKH